MVSAAETVAQDRVLAAAFRRALRALYASEVSVARGLGSASRRDRSACVRAMLADLSAASAERAICLERVLEKLGPPPRIRGKAWRDVVAQEIRERMAAIGAALSGGEDVVVEAQALETLIFGRYGTLLAWSRKLALASAASVLGEVLAEAGEGTHFPADAVIGVGHELLAPAFVSISRVDRRDAGGARGG